MNVEDKSNKSPEEMTQEDKERAYLAGISSLLGKQWQEAIKYLEPLAQENFLDAMIKLKEAYSGYGHQFLEEGKWDEAREYFEKAGDTQSVKEAEEKKQQQLNAWFQSAQEALIQAETLLKQGIMDRAEEKAKEAQNLFRQILEKHSTYRYGEVQKGQDRVQSLLKQISLWNQLLEAWRSGKYDTVLTYGNQILAEIPWHQQISVLWYKEVVAKCRHARKELREPAPKRRVPTRLGWIGVAIVSTLITVLLVRNVERELLAFVLIVLLPIVAAIGGVGNFMLKNVGGLARTGLERLVKTWGMLLGSLIVGVLIGLILVCWNRRGELIGTPVTSTSRRKSFGSFTVLNARANCQQSDCGA